MEDKDFSKYFVTELKKNVDEPHFKHETPVQAEGTRKQIFWVDDDILPGAFYSEYMWHYPCKESQQNPNEINGTGPHTHPFGEVISFVGTNEKDLFDLGGEVEIWLEDQKFTLTKSFLVFIPAGMRHGPIKMNRVDAPIFQYVLGDGSRYEYDESPQAPQSSGIDLSKQFVFTYRKWDMPEYREKKTEDPGRHDHIAFLDGETVPGASFYIEASWMGTKPRDPLKPGETRGPGCHEHPFPEVIPFFGTNPDDIYDLGGEVELWIDNKQYILNRSFVAFIPGDIPHCPLLINKVNTRMFHFTTAPAKKYI